MPDPVTRAGIDGDRRTTRNGDVAVRPSGVAIPSVRRGILPPDARIVNSSRPSNFAFRGHGPGQLVVAGCPFELPPRLEPVAELECGCRRSSSPIRHLRGRDRDRALIGTLALEATVLALISGATGDTGWPFSVRRAIPGRIGNPESGSSSCLRAQSPRSGERTDQRRRVSPLERLDDRDRATQPRAPRMRGPEVSQRPEEASAWRTARCRGRACAPLPSGCSAASRSVLDAVQLGERIGELLQVRHLRVEEQALAATDQTDRLLVAFHRRS